MAETSIKISLELADKAAQKALSDFIGQGDKAEKSLKKMGDAGRGTFSEIAVSIGKASGIYDIFVGNLAANLATKAFEGITSAANTLFQTFIVDGVKASQEAEDALNSLNVALAQSGQYSAQTSAEFVDFAEELQRTTIYEDDLIIKNAALIQSLAQLEKDGLKRATAASLDLAAGLAGKGLSVEAASEALGKAANGNVTALQKMGIVIQKGRTDAETFANALKGVEDRFGGAAASKVSTYSGAVALATNNFGNLTEEIGNFIVKNPAVIEVLKEVSAIFVELTDVTKGQNAALLELVGGGISLFAAASAGLVLGLDIVVRAFQALYGVAQTVVMPIIGITGAVIALTKGLDEGAAFINRFSKSASDNLNSLGESGDGALLSLGNNFLRIKDAADRGLEAIAKGADTSVEPVNKIGGAVQKLSEETVKAREQLKSFALELVNKAATGQAAADQEVELARAKSESEQAILQEQLDAQQISYYDYNLRRAEIDAEFEVVRQASEAEKLAADQDRILQARNASLISEQQYLTARQQLNTQYTNEQIKRDTELAKRDAANKKALLAQEKAYGFAKVQAVSDVFGAVGSIAALGGKKNFEIVKAFNLAEAITAGILSIQKAAASAPPPFNIPAIVSASVLSAANVARIAATKAPSFESGGIVPGSSFSGDRVAANVNSGEMILNRNQQATLFKMANGGDSGSELRSLLVQTNALLGAILQKDTNVIVGGRVITDVLRSELASGRTFA